MTFAPRVSGAQLVQPLSVPPVTTVSSRVPTILVCVLHARRVITVKVVLMSLLFAQPVTTAQKVLS